MLEQIPFKQISQKINAFKHGKKYAQGHYDKL